VPPPRGRADDRLSDDSAAQLYAAILLSSEQAILSKDLSGVILTWNQGAQRLFGYAADEAIGRPLTIIFPPHREDEETIIFGRIRHIQAIDQRETVLRRNDGSYFDNVRHDRLLAKVAQRVDDADVMHLLKVMLKAGGKQGVPQGGVISPLLSNIYLTEVDRMLERAEEARRYDKYTYVEYPRFADDLVILIDAHQRHDWLVAVVEKRLREELAELQVEINEEKSRIVDLRRGESFGFLGFDFRRVRSLRGVWRAHYTPSSKSGQRCYASSRMYCLTATAFQSARRELGRVRSKRSRSPPRMSQRRAPRLGSKTPISCRRRRRPAPSLRRRRSGRTGARRGWPRIGPRACFRWFWLCP
jgi:PAS domain S-box-containing protein